MLGKYNDAIDTLKQLKHKNHIVYSGNKKLENDQIRAFHNHIPT